MKSRKFWMLIFLTWKLTKDVQSDIETTGGTINELLGQLLSQSNYNKLIRPVQKHKDIVTTFLGLKLTQILELNMKDQMVMTNVWLMHEWRDIHLRWNPVKYGGVKQLHVPSSRIWIPDIVLYNNADGKYEVTIMTKARIFYDGTVRWDPPAVYRSSCDVNVEFFPYDIQSCAMRFASWTYHGNKMILQHYLQRKVPHYITNKYHTVHIDYAADLHSFYPSVEFDILEISAVRRARYEKRSVDQLHEVEFTLVMRRKTLFYTVNLMMPCLAMAFLSLLVFYLPAESGEKISLSINLMLSLTIFFQVLVTSTPSTGQVIPLIGKYLLFTIILISLSIIISVCVLNVKFRTSISSYMTPSIRYFLFQILPPILLLPTGPVKSQDANRYHTLKSAYRCTVLNNPEARPYSPLLLKTVNSRDNRKISAYAKESISKPYSLFSANNSKVGIFSNDSEELTQKLEETVQRLEYVMQHLQESDTSNKIQEEWRFLAVLMDRLFLILFLTAYILGTLGIIFRSPALRDTRTPLTQTNFPNRTILTFYNDYNHFILQVNATL